MITVMTAAQASDTGGEVMPERWHIVYTNPNCEDRAQKWLKLFGFATYKPIYRKVVTVRRRVLTEKGRSTITTAVEVARNLFPRYVFVGLQNGLSCWDIRRADGVKAILSRAQDAGAGRPSDFVPVVVARDKIEALQCALDMGLFDQDAERPPVLKVHDHVRIVGDILPGMVTAIDTGAGEADVVIQMFGRGNAVRLPLDRLERVA